MSFHRPCASDSSKSLEMNPFLKTLKQPCPPLHPCWYNSCENLGDWAIDTGITGSINNTVFQENTGSLQLVFPDTPAKYAKLIPVSNCGRYWGFWVRIVGNIPTYFYAIIFGTPIDYYIQWYIDTGNWGFRVKNTFGQANNRSDIVIQSDTWYWMEAFYDVGTGYSFSVDGVPKWNYTVGGLVGDFSEFWLRNVSGGGVFTVLCDYIRETNRYEYPPT